MKLDFDAQQKNMQASVEIVHSRLHTVTKTRDIKVLGPRPFSRKIQFRF